MIMCTSSTKHRAILQFVLLLALCSFGSVHAQEQTPAEPYVVHENKPGFYTGFAFVGYQGREISSDFSTISYRTTATGMMWNYASRYFGLNLNVFRAFAFREFIFDREAAVLVNWAETGISFPLLRRWAGKGFFSKYSLMLTANTSLFKKLYRQRRDENGTGSSKYIEETFPQIYDFGLEFRRNLILFKLGYITQIRKYTATHPEFARVPSDMSGPYFEMAVGLGFWSKRQESHVLRQKEKIEEQAPAEMHAEIEFTEPNGNGKLDGGEIGAVKIALENSGKGQARGIEVRLRYLNRKHENLAFSQSIRVDNLAPKSSTTLEVPISADREAQDDQVELEVEISGRNFDRITKEIGFAVQEYDYTDEPRHTNLQNPDAIAVVIGIRDYQNPQIPAVAYAANDAKVFRDYLINTLGVKPDNILPQNPDEPLTAGAFKTLIRRKLPGYIREGISEVYFYYAGHGAPDPNAKDAFLVPYDCDPNFVNADNAYRLGELYFDLANLKARHLTIIIDACFSGYGGDGRAIIRNISPVRLQVQNPLMLHPAVTFFTSSQIEQVSHWYPEKRHGLFTYFFLKGLRGKADANGDRKITAGEMKAFLKDPNNGVPYWSMREFQRPQEPVAFSSDPERVMVDYSEVVK
ncbi:MAG: caspase family protein [candidate division KSB1 bacterium]|nr:caspase family protein [candidate division KSB1 bacterium]MDZ7304475.1 caspase family protein [candidate division KSB1 bacterium]MDZ7312982.1 caspase family protein [candidate division KSB1 bacterium]